MGYRGLPYCIVLHRIVLYINSQFELKLIRVTVCDGIKPSRKEYEQTEGGLYFFARTIPIRVVLLYSTVQYIKNVA